MWIFSGGSQAKVKEARCCDNCIFYNTNDDLIGICELDNTKEEKIVNPSQICGFYESIKFTSL